LCRGKEKNREKRREEQEKKRGREKELLRPIAKKI
jgi:hypothetical protein